MELRDIKITIIRVIVYTREATPRTHIHRTFLCRLARNVPRTTLFFTPVSAKVLDMKVLTVEVNVASVGLCVTFQKSSLFILKE